MEEKGLQNYFSKEIKKTEIIIKLMSWNYFMKMFITNHIFLKT